MSMSFPVTIIKDFNQSATHVASSLEGGSVAATDMHVVMVDIVLDMMRAFLALFNSQGRRGGGSWKRLKDETIRRKGSAIILVKSGQLRDSLSKPGAPYQIINFIEHGENTIEFGTDDPVAAVHHYGSKARNIPSRPIIKFTPQDTSRWRNMITAHLMKPFMHRSEV